MSLPTELVALIAAIVSTLLSALSVDIMASKSLCIAFAVISFVLFITSGMLWSNHQDVTSQQNPPQKIQVVPGEERVVGP